MDPQKFSGQNQGPGEIPTVFQLEMLLAQPSTPDTRPPCKWPGCKVRALWLITLLPACHHGAEPACAHHTQVIETLFSRHNAQIMCRYCHVSKTSIEKEPIRHVER